MWTNEEVIIRSTSKIERYRREAEVARTFPGRPLRRHLAAGLRRLADRLERVPCLPNPQGARA